MPCNQKSWNNNEVINPTFKIKISVLELKAENQYCSNKNDLINIGECLKCLNMKEFVVFIILRKQKMNRHKIKILKQNN